MCIAAGHRNRLSEDYSLSEAASNSFWCILSPSVLRLVITAFLLLISACALDTSASLTARNEITPIRTNATNNTADRIIHGVSGGERRSQREGTLGADSRIVDGGVGYQSLFFDATDSYGG